MKNSILSQLNAECPWRDTLLWFDTIDSTNTHAKQLAAQGAPHGTVLLAGQQTGGRGRMGRSFSSPAGKGLYLSVILRPHCKAEELMHLTCAAAVAACNAVETVSGFRPDVKWINDLIANDRKLGGILTELSIAPDTGLVNYAIIGIGINCSQTPEDFPDDIRHIAISLETATGQSCNYPVLAATLIDQLAQICDRLLWKKAQIMVLYRRNCITLGKAVTVIRGEDAKSATALSVDESGGLLVQYDDGTEETVSSGEVSIRGLMGYI